MTAHATDQTDTLATFPSSDALAQVVGSTAEALLGADACTLSEHEATSIAFSRAATVAIIGEEQATIIIRTDEAVARYYAMLMFEQTDETLAEVDITDSLLELTNVLGGAAKTLFAGECSLNLPLLLGDPAAHDSAPSQVTLALAGGYVQMLLHPGSGA